MIIKKCSDCELLTKDCICEIDDEPTDPDNLACEECVETAEYIERLEDYCEDLRFEQKHQERYPV